MKKTLTVNLGGTVYNIDEDAYVLLDNYLNNLRYHFRAEDGADEIVSDMEERISELFNEYLAAGIRVITITQVEEVIVRMGKPEELDGDISEESPNAPTAEAASTKKGPRRLFRNPDDRIIGGVLSGIAAYLDWDATLVRCAFIAAAFISFGWLAFFYLVAWIILPKASTATEKLQMRGEPVNVETIGRTVTDGFDKVNAYVRSGKPQSTLRRIGEVIVNLVGALIKFVLVVIGICLIPLLLIALYGVVIIGLTACGLFISIPSFFYHMFPLIDWNALMSASPAFGAGLSVCGLLAIGLPIVGVLQLVMQGLNIWRPMSTSLKVILILLWMISVVVGIILMVHGYTVISGPTYIM